MSLPKTASPAPRSDGYAPLREYAPIGDGRTVALVARDGGIDWLPFPALDSPSVFASMLDSARGGRFVLEPEVPCEVARRYRGDTNVLETTFRTDRGVATVTDALTLPDLRLEPFRELQRRIVGVSGRIPFRWWLEPSFGYADLPLRIGRRSGIPVATSRDNAVALLAFDAGEPQLGERSISGRFEIAAGSSSLIALSFAHQEPLVFPPRDQLEARLNSTVAFWQRWADGRTYKGPWRNAVIRSALALKLLVYAPSGAVAAAATTSLPEELGGARNWDYRFSWIRDSAFTIDALLQLGCPAEAQAYFWWLMHATQLAQPRLQVLYRLDGGTRVREHELPLAGYRGSRPVRIGNGAAEQLQLDTYGELLQTGWLYARDGNRIDHDVAHRLAAIAWRVCAIWRQPDAGIWEVRSRPAHFTQSKMMCAVALERAVQLAEQGVLPDKHVVRWRTEATAIRRFVETRCWSDEKRSYVRHDATDRLDASLLLGLLHGYANGDDERIRSTVEAIRRELADGPLVHRYVDEDGLAGGEGAFLACSFWLAEALARIGRADEAAALMEELLGLANDVGVYSEEIDPSTGELLGNMPQALTHLALIGAAIAIAEAGR